MPFRFEDIIASGESAKTEFKRSLADTRRIVETIAAMAGVGGGVILVGVSDDGRVVGVELGDGAIEQFTQRVLAATDPKVFITTSVETVAGRPVLVVRVPAGDGPHLAGGRAFTRSGPATVQLTRAEYERRLLDRLREAGGFERQWLEGAQESDIDVETLAEFAELAAPRGVSWSGRPAELLERLHLLRDGRPTVGAILLFGRDPQRPLPQASVRLRVERGASEEGLSVDGPVLHQLPQVVDQILLRLRARTDRSGVRRTEVPELPLVAVRESVANALAHRDYRSTAPTQLRITDDALSIWNPGSLPEPLTVASLHRAHPSVPPNPYIARALYLAGYIEEWGTGTLRVIDAMAAAGNPPPIYQAELGGISVTLPLLGAPAAVLSERQGVVLALLQSAPGPLTAASLASDVGVSTRTMHADLQRLEELGLARRQGRGRAVRWKAS